MVDLSNLLTYIQKYYRLVSERWNKNVFVSRTTTLPMCNVKIEYNKFVMHKKRNLCHAMVKFYFLWHVIIYLLLRDKYSKWGSKQNFSVARKIFCCRDKTFDVAQKVIWCQQKQVDVARKGASCQQNNLMLPQKVFHVGKNKMMLNQESILCHKNLLIFFGKYVSNMYNFVKMLCVLLNQIIYCVLHDEFRRRWNSMCAFSLWTQKGRRRTHIGGITQSNTLFTQKMYH